MKINLLLLFLAPCVAAAQSTTVTRSLPSFDAIALSGGYDHVYLKEGDAESVTLKVSGTNPDNIETEVKNGKLGIRTKKGNFRNLRAEITITYRNLHKIANSGSSNIETLTPIKTREFEYSSSGSGDFIAVLDVQDLDIALSGSSNLELSGQARSQEISISGSANVKARSLKGDSASVAISGSGNVLLGVTGPVKTAVSGSGSVQTIPE